MLIKQIPFFRISYPPVMQHPCCMFSSYLLLVLGIFPPGLLPLLVRISLLRSLFELDEDDCDPIPFLFSFSRLLLPEFFVVGMIF
jgi:hypothetical protein